VIILDTIVPVFLVVALGAWLQRSGFLSAGFLKEANHLTYWVGLPALFFGQLAAGLPSMAGVKALLGVMLMITGLMIVTGFVVARLLGLRGGVTGTFIQGSFRGNLAFVGLPVIFGLPDLPLMGGVNLHSAAVIVIAPVMLVYNVMGVGVLLASQHKFGWAMVGPMLKQLALTPPLVAIAAGMLFSALGWHLPVFAGRTLAAVGEMALPLGLLGVGGAMVTSNLATGWRLPFGSALLKTMLAPVLAYLCGRWWGLDDLSLKLVMIFAACPTAIISYTVALALKGDDKLASSIIGISVLTSIVSLAIIVSL
jgi:malate permease and related proteins